MQPTVAWIFFLHHTCFYYTLISVTKSGSSSDPFVGPTLVLNKQQIIKSNSGSTRRLNVSQNVFLFGGELSADTENLVLIYQWAATKFVKIFPVLASISQEASQQIDSRGYKLYVGGTHLNQGPHKSSSHARGVLPVSPLCWAKHWAFLCSPCRVSAFKFFIRPRYVKARHWRLAKLFQNMKYKIRRYVQARCRPARYFEMLNPKFIASFHSSADLTLMSKWEVLSNLPPKSCPGRPTLVSPVGTVCLQLCSYFPVFCSQRWLCIQIFPDNVIFIAHLMPSLHLSFWKQILN